MILNNVKNLKTITVDEFLSLNFNKLKDENRNVDKLVNSIKKTGWNFPVFVWAGNDFVIDGAGRRLAVEELLKQGETITEIPVIEIFAETLEEAKLKTLEASSQFGFITEDSFIEFTEDIEIDTDVFDINFSDTGNIDMLGTVNKGNENDEWVGMPEFDEKDETFKIIIHCESEEYRDEFIEKHNIELSKKERNTWSTNYPFKERDDLSSVKYE